MKTHNLKFQRIQRAAARIQFIVSADTAASISKNQMIPDPPIEGPDNGPPYDGHI